MAIIVSFKYCRDYVFMIKMEKINKNRENKPFKIVKIFIPEEFFATYSLFKEYVMLDSRVAAVKNNKALIKNPFQLNSFVLRKLIEKYVIEQRQIHIKPEVAILAEAEK